ncbi:MAG TPA: DNA mismatch repair protein MutS, partial [Clostridiaceae bacterium]|nr:DNA mismatch repair protein MutS [Clostridiaceae bacterium]
MSETGPVFKKWTDQIDREQLTPMMRQYVEQKELWPDCLLFFRLGDFYELFFDDAIIASEALEITLTSRDCGLKERAPMCGVPYHAADNYLAKLMDQNFKVAICEQMEDPATTKGLVKRQVVRVVTPGTVTDLQHLEDKRNNFLVSVFQVQMYYGLAALDIMTGSFEATSISYGMTEDKVIAEIERYAPAEILANPLFSKSTAAQQVAERRSITITTLPEEAFDAQIWQSYIGEKSDAHDLWAKSAAGLLHYVKKTQLNIPDHVESVERYDIAGQLHLDVAARRNLELTETLRDHSRRGSLLWTIDRTSTSMGGRMLRRWLEQPLIEPMDILLRQSAVSTFHESFIQRQELREQLRGMTDLERLTGKLSFGSVNARDLLALGNTLAKLPNIKNTIEGLDTLYIKQLNDSLDPMPDLTDLLERAINPDPPIGLKDGQLIKSGFSKEIDQLREADKNGRQWILDLEQREREQTGIKNLKVGYNRVFGYYLEVTKSNLDAVPDHYIRKQTLTNSERFYTPELKNMEDSILGAKQRVIDVEYELFCQIRDTAKTYVSRLRRTAGALAALDTLQGLAEQADRANYCRPTVDANDVIAIKGGRHPVVERMLGPGAFVPNDTAMDR